MKRRRHEDRVAGVNQRLHGNRVVETFVKTQADPDCERVYRACGYVEWDAVKLPSSAGYGLR